MEYIVVRQNRKTAVLVINNKLQLIVKVPKYVTKKQIEHFVKLNEKWISETVTRKQQLMMKNDWFQTGQLLFLGTYYPVRLQADAGKKSEVVFTGESITVRYNGTEEDARCQMEKFFRRAANEKLTELAEAYADLIGVKYNKISIRKQATRWGSCSSKGNLSFNLKILCAPIEMVAYVALHEVMHLKHFNHSRDFWNEIQQVMPDYKKRMNYFKQFGQNFII